jgi:uncharacterized membrane protein YkvA (DUF1232 family)
LTGAPLGLREFTAMPKIASRIGLMGEAAALAVALFDKRSPWTAKVAAGAAIFYLIDPFDVMPDLIPILGWIDDLVVAPLGLWLATKLIPRDVMTDARARFSKNPGQQI